SPADVSGGASGRPPGNPLTRARPSAPAGTRPSRRSDAPEAGGRPHTTAARLAPQTSGKPLPGPTRKPSCPFLLAPRWQEDNSSLNRLMLEESHDRYYDSTRDPRRGARLPSSGRRPPVRQGAARLTGRGRGNLPGDAQVAVPVRLQPPRGRLVCHDPGDRQARRDVAHLPDVHARLRGLLRALLRRVPASRPE